MKPIKGYAEAQVVTDRVRLPIGGYVLKIMDAEEIPYNWGDVIKISFDIAEGEHKDFYAHDYRSQTDDKKWKGTYRLNVSLPKSNSDEDMAKFKRSLGFFKGQIQAIEKSNNITIDCTKKWDVKVLKGKLVGAVFNDKEYDYEGKRGFFTNCHSLKTVDDIRNNKFKIPDPTMLKDRTPTAAIPAEIVTVLGDFEELSDGDLPF